MFFFIFVIVLEKKKSYIKAIFSFSIPTVVFSTVLFSISTIPFFFSCKHERKKGKDDVVFLVVRSNWWN